MPHERGKTHNTASQTLTAPCWLAAVKVKKKPDLGVTLYRAKLKSHSFGLLQEFKVVSGESCAPAPLVLENLLLLVADSLTFKCKLKSLIFLSSVCCVAPQPATATSEAPSWCLSTNCKFLQIISLNSSLCLLFLLSVPQALFISYLFFSFSSLHPLRWTSPCWGTSPSPCFSGMQMLDLGFGPCRASLLFVLFVSVFAENLN